MTGKPLLGDSGVPTITVTVERRDALAMVLGPLDYAVKVTAGEVEAGASPMRLRCALAEALREGEAVKADVFSRPECVFVYCPNPETCKAQGCQHVHKPPEAH